MIRHAQTEDIEHLILLGHEMHEESPRYRQKEFDIEKVANFFLQCLSNDDFLLLVAERDGKIIGGIAAFVSTQWFNNDLISGDFGLFLHRDHRGGLSAAGLVNRYIYWARSKGVKDEDISISQTTDVNVDGYTRLVEATGFVKIGNVFQHGGQ